MAVGAFVNAEMEKQRGAALHSWQFFDSFHSSGCAEQGHPAERKKRAPADARVPLIQINLNICLYGQKRKNPD